MIRLSDCEAYGDVFQGTWRIRRKKHVRRFRFRRCRMHTEDVRVLLFSRPGFEGEVLGDGSIETDSFRDV